MSKLHSVFKISFLYVACLGCTLCHPRDNSRQQILIPYIEGENIFAYKPQGDVFSGPHTKNLMAGQYYPNWQPNDHCFIQGSDNRWHAFGITHPAAELGERVRHDDEFISFHAVSPGDKFEYSFLEEAWTDKPKVLPPSQRPGESVSNHAPTIVKHGYTGQFRSGWQFPGIYTNGTPRLA